jgi:hypothetical protein
VRHAARCRHGTHINQELDTMVAQKLDELIERSGGVPDRQDLGQELR